MKLTQKQIKQLEELQQAHKERTSKLLTIIDGYNESVRKSHEALSVAIEQYNDGTREAAEAIQAIGEEYRSAWDDRSERWQEGEAGSAAADWIAVYEDFHFEELETPELPEMQRPDSDEYEKLAELPHSQDDV